MIFSCTQENFNQGLSVVSHIASKNVNLPILNNILIKAAEGVIKFSATNLEVGIACTIRGKVEKEGDFTIPARVLADYVSLLPTEEKVKAALQEDQLEINCNNYQTKLKGEPASEFPLIPQIEKKSPFILEGGEFLKAIQQVIFAVAISETRPEISGVLLKFQSQEKKLTLATTDSYRLAEKTIELKQVSGEDKRIIVPAQTLQEVQRILTTIARSKEVNNEADNNLEIYLNDNQILFVYNNIELISRLIEGQYPDYSSIIPENHRTQVIISTTDLSKAVKSASLFVKTGINDISLEIKPENKITISSVNAQVGENISTLEANITGDDNSVILNYRYLLDGLQALGTSEILMEVIDNNTPVVLKPVLASAEEGIDRDYLYLIMPIKQ